MHGGLIERTTQTGEVINVVEQLDLPPLEIVLLHVGKRIILSVFTRVIEVCKIFEV